MLDIYLTRFSVKGRTKKALVRDVREWAAKALNVEVEDLAVDGDSASPGFAAGRWLVEGPSDIPTAFDVSIKRHTDDGLVVVEHVEVTSGKRPVITAATSVGVETAGKWRPFHGGMYPPAVVSEIVTSGDATDGSTVLRSEPWVVTPELVDDFIALLEGGRRLPVVCFSEDRMNGPAIDPGRAAMLLAGAAHPVLLTYDASMKLTQLKDKRWSTFLGAVRVYRPGLNWDGSTRHHPLWLVDRIHDPEAIPDAARQVCVDEARWNGLDKWSIPRMRLDRLRAQSDSDGDDWVELLEDVESERDELRLEVNSLQREIARLRGESTEPPPPSSISEALATVAEGSTPGLVILDSAWESAATASFRRHDRALEVLEAVAELAEAYHGRSLDQDFRSFLKDRGVKLGFVSSHVRSRWADDYQRTYHGRTIELSDHAKVGSGSPEDLFRVYWYRDETERVLVVGHVGNHLTNRQS